MPDSSIPSPDSLFGSQSPRPIRHTAHALEDGLVVVDHENDQLIVLNSSAGLVWQWLVEGADFELMADRMAAIFDIPTAVAARDIAAAYAVWTENGLLRESTSDSRLSAMPTRAPRQVPSETQVTPEGCFPYSEKTYLLSTEPFRLRYQTQDLESIFHPLMAHLEIADRITRWDYELRAGGREYVLLRNRKEMHRDTLIGLIQGRLVMEVLQISYPNKEWLAVAHAGAVSDHRRAVVMPARSGSGKSTLTAALVHSGLSYFGDDIIPLTRKGPLAVPFPTRMGLKEGSWPVLAAYYPELSSSPIYRHRGLKVRYLDPLPSGETVPEPVPVGCLVFPQYDPGATSQLTELSALESLQRFIEARVFIGNPIESRKVEDLLDWIAGVRRYALRYSDLGQAARMVRELLTQ